MWLNANRVTEYKNLKDENSSVSIQKKVERLHVDVYDDSGRVVHWEEPKEY